ncbi:MAG: histidine triad nucleotide-binding protein [Acidobacteriota bacterium]
MTSARDCLFCRIIGGEIDATIRYQDDRVIAFEDIAPQAPHHVLICPRKHIATLNDLGPEDETLMGHIVMVGAKLAGEMGDAVKGYRLVANCQSGAGQSVFHIHFHLLGGRRFRWPPG